VTAPLPLRDGIAPSYVWLPAGAWSYLLDFLVQRFPHIDADTWKARMARGEVVDAQGQRLVPDSPYRHGMCVFYYRELEGETPIPYEEIILHQDAHLLVVDKPHFLPVTPSGRFLHETLLVRLKRKTGLSHLTPIHRLDRETAGVIVFSHRPDTRGLYQALFREKAVTKIYEAFAPHLPGATFPFTYRSRLVRGQAFFRTEEAAGEPNSETQIDVLARHGEFSLYALRPITGKKHQLRVHLASLGIPIVNDAFYPEALPCKGDDFSLPLQLLARSIAFTDPVSGQARLFASTRQLQGPSPVTAAQQR
jgi:tRNA pseudouridine32 synthase/23S rRNA pseudouridine746 synthase